MRMRLVGIACWGSVYVQWMKVILDSSHFCLSFPSNRKAIFTYTIQTDTSIHIMYFVIMFSIQNYSCVVVGGA